MKVILFACILLFCVIAKSSALTRNQKRCKKFNNNIQIYYPQGLAVKYPAEANLQSLVLKVYVNQANIGERSCDVCANKTVTNGYVMIHNSSVVARHQDLFQYTVAKKFHSGRTSHALYCTFHVDGTRLMPAPSSQSQAYPMPSRKTIAKSSKQRTNYLTEKALLKEMITELIDSCHHVTKTLIFDSERSSFLDKSDLQEYAITRLTSLIPSVDWSEELENVYLSGEMIVFDVKTILMKKTIMHMIRGTDVADRIIDYDRRERSEYDGEIDYDFDTATDMYNVIQDE